MDIFDILLAINTLISICDIYIHTMGFYHTEEVVAWVIVVCCILSVLTLLYCLGRRWSAAPGRRPLGLPHDDQQPLTHVVLPWDDAQ